LRGKLLIKIVIGSVGFSKTVELSKGLFHKLSIPSLVTPNNFNRSQFGAHHQPLIELEPATASSPAGPTARGDNE